MVVWDASLILAGTSRIASGSELKSLRLAIEPFDLEQTLDGGQAFRWHRSEEGAFRGVIGTRVFGIGIDGLAVSMTWEGNGESDEVEQEINDYLQAEVDVGEVRRVLSSEPGFGECVAETPLIRVLRQDPWECLVEFICSQNSNIPRIKQMIGSVARMGRRIGDDDWAYEFPTVEVVADAGEDHLRSIGLGYRGKHLALAAAALVGWGDGELTGLREASYYEAKDALMVLQGVGPKVADCILAYSLDKGEAFPVDVHVRRAAIRLYGLDENVKNESVGEWARDRFGKYAAWAQLYMFRDEINRRSVG